MAADPPVTPPGLSPAAVRALPAGRLLDCHVSVALGLHAPELLDFFPGVPEDHKETQSLVGRYSTDDAHAVWLIDALARRGVYLSVHRYPDGYRCEAWHGEGRRLLPGVAGAETFPLCVARCALLCVPHLQPVEATPAAGRAP